MIALESMGWARGAALGMTGWLALAGCDAAPPGTPMPDGGLPTDGAPTRTDAWVSSEACAMASPLADEGEPCCPALGPDACGAAQFCAAFDGRTIPTCYRERSRNSGESCTDDRQCVHGSCNLEVGRCRAGEGEGCERAIGCAPSMAGARQICASTDGVRGTCEPNTGVGSAWCRFDDDCLDGTCTRYSGGRCGDGRHGDTCDDDDDCLVGPCIEHRCQDGRPGARCRVDGDCADGPCLGEVCQAGRVRDRCRVDADCSSGRCLAGECSAGLNGDSCERATDCATFCNLRTNRCGASCSSAADCGEGMLCSVSHRCMVPGPGEFLAACTRDEDCRSGGCTATYPRTDALVCTEPGDAGSACDEAHPCTSPTYCRNNRCVLPAGQLCGLVTDAYSFVTLSCGPGLVCDLTYPTQRRCDPDFSRACRTNADCGEGLCASLWACQ